jgi:hypothetical protein
MSMSDLVSEFDNVYSQALSSINMYDLANESTTSAMKNLRVLSECRPPVVPEPEATPEPPTTVRGKLMAGTARVWDNETTRVFIKAGGAFAGVALVVWSTIHRDQVIQREALSQANQRNS